MRSLLIGALLFSLAQTVSADNIITLSSQAEHDAYLTNEVVFTTTIRAGGGAANELIADIDDGFPDTEGDISWSSGTSYDFSFDYTLSGSADLSVTLPGDVEESVSKSPTTWFDTLLIQGSTPGFVSLTLSGLTINGESVADISTGPFGGWGGYAVEIPGNSSSNVAVANISGTFTPTYSTGAGGDDFNVEITGVQQGNIQSVPEPGTVALLGIGLAVCYIARRRKYS